MEENKGGDVIVVHLSKTRYRGFGLDIFISNQLYPCYPRVINVWPGSVAELSGRIAAGDSILSLNGISLANLALEQFENIFRTVQPDTVAELLVRRAPNLGPQRD